MPLLLDLEDPRLYPGDILRLSDNYDLGPGSGPVDLMVYNPRADDCGLGLIVLSGYKAGLILHNLPKESTYSGGFGLSVKWLKTNWDLWFTYTYERAARIPIEKAVVLRKEQRTLPEET